MTLKKYLKAFRAFYLSPLVFFVLGTSQLAAQDDDSEDDIFELSPFSVSGDNEGYRATTTLAGTRLNTQLKDIGSAIQVMTSEMFEDTGATDAETILSYAISAEVGGEQGNFAGAADISGSHTNTDPGRINPQGNQRIRGLEPATLTRNYFVTDIAFDSYNIDSVTINRGPNALLFGIGTPGGVIENTTKRAFFGNEFTEVSARYGSQGSYRATFDLNRELVDGRLAARVAGLAEKKYFRQDPAFDQDERLYLALEWLLSKNEGSDFFDETRVRLNLERGNIASNPVNVTPPTDSFSHWFQAPDSITQYTGIDDPVWITPEGYNPKTTVDNSMLVDGNEGAGTAIADITTWQFALIYDDPNGSGPSTGAGFGDVTAVQARIPFRGGTPETSPSGNRNHVGAYSFYTKSEAPGFRVPTVNDRNVWDSVNNLLTGNTGFVNRDFTARNLTLEQTFMGGRAGVEVVLDKQELDLNHQLPFGGGGTGGGTRAMDVGIDISQYLINPNGADDFWVENPNLGRPVIRQQALETTWSTSERSAARATAFFIQDFTESEGWSRWLGKHTMTGFYNETDLDVTSHTRRVSWTADGASFDTDRTLNLNNNIIAWRANAFIPIYIGPSLLGSEYQSGSDVRLEQMNLTLPRPGETHAIHYFDRDTNTAATGTATLAHPVSVMDRTRTTITTEAAAIQSSFLKDSLVALAGWRTDEQRTTGRASISELPDGTDRLPDNSFDLSDNFLSATENQPQEGSTFTWSLVGHLPWELPGGVKVSAHYNNSENFNPVGNRVDVYNQQVGSPQGTTQDYGVSFEAFEGKLVARLNWFETRSSNVNAGLTANAVNDFIADVLIGQFNPQTVSVNVPDPENPEVFLENPTEVEMWNYWVSREPEAVEKGMLERWPTFQDYRQGMLELIPEEVQAARGYYFDPDTLDLLQNGDGFDGTVIATQGALAEGVELDLVGQITNSWRVALNVSQQETVVSDIAPEVSRNLAYWSDTLEPLGVMDFDWGIDFGGGGPARGRFNVVGLNPVAAKRALEGTVSPEQRKYRANLITNYNFRDGKFKGLGIGGGLRWQSSNTIGFAIEPLPGTEGQGLVRPIIDQPIEGDALTTGDFWASYKKPIFDGKVDWKVQLNVRNAIADRGYQAVYANPDGSIAVVRNPPPLDVFLTNTFRF
ncbi:MAG: TonB-dependent receptor plug domain-containing protein [Verrucomicrobiota bacterium]